MCVYQSETNSEGERETTARATEEKTTCKRKREKKNEFIYSRCFAQSHLLLQNSWGSYCSTAGVRQKSTDRANIDALKVIKQKQRYQKKIKVRQFSFSFTCFAMIGPKHIFERRHVSSMWCIFNHKDKVEGNTEAWLQQNGRSRKSTKPG